MLETTWTVLALLTLAALVAGYVDAVVGGGGLIQLPALLIGLPAASPLQLLATNKLVSICGTSMASATYYRRIKPDPKTFGPLMAGAFVGAMAGAVVASFIPREAFEPMVLVALIIVGGYVVWRPDVGEQTTLKLAGRRHIGAAVLTGLAIGFYDGALGPGTGSFFVIALVALLGYSFLDASAKSRLANWATNLASLIIFVPQGAVLWKIGLAMGLANLVGGYLGSVAAVDRGSKFVRVFFMIVVGVLTLRVAASVFGLV